MMKKLDKIRKGVVALFLPSLCAGLGVFFSSHIQASAENGVFTTNAQTESDPLYCLFRYDVRLPCTDE